jgi:large subunit ribosomal protein L2
VSNKITPVGIQDTTASTTKLLSVGDLAPLSSFEVGDFIHSVEAFPGQGPVFARSAGTYCQFRGQYSADQTGEALGENALSGKAKVRLPSGSVRLISLSSHAVLGSVGNSAHNQRNLVKAGRSRWLGRRPSVRGVARNPVDHPHGGGQGKTSGGRPSVTFKS